MPFDLELTGLQLVVAGAAFGLVMAVWVGILIWWRATRGQRTERVERRLGLIEETPGTRVLRLWYDGHEETMAAPSAPKRQGFMRQLALMCKEAGWSTPPTVLLSSLGCVAGVIFILVLVLTGQLLAGLAGVVVTLMLAWAWLKRAISKRSELFDRQFVDAMDLARRSLRAGHPLVAAFQLVSQEIDDPVGALFAEICEHQELGADLEQALRDAASRCASEDMKLFATSVAMQTHSGGNLSAMIERLAQVIRDRIKLSRRVRVLTAQTQFSKRVLVALPILLFVLLNALNPQYMQPLYTTSTGKIMLAAATASVLMGTWVMGRMIRLDT